MYSGFIQCLTCSNTIRENTRENNTENTRKLADHTFVRKTPFLKGSENVKSQKTLPSNRRIPEIKLFFTLRVSHLNLQLIVHRLYWKPDGVRCRRDLQSNFSLCTSPKPWWSIRLLHICNSFIQPNSTHSSSTWITIISAFYTITKLLWFPRFTCLNRFTNLTM